MKSMPWQLLPTWIMSKSLPCLNMKKRPFWVTCWEERSTPIFSSMLSVYLFLQTLSHENVEFLHQTLQRTEIHWPQRNFGSRSTPTSSDALGCFLWWTHMTTMTTKPQHLFLMRHWKQIAKLDVKILLHEVSRCSLAVEAKEWMMLQGKSEKIRSRSDHTQCNRTW
jgi:hypothetical protein